MPNDAPKTIETESDIRAGIKALRRKCPVLRRAHDLAGDPPLRRHRPDFEGLANIVVAQQLSVASATAIWRKLTLSLVPLTPETILAADDATLRAAGLSRPKVRTLRALSVAIVLEGLDLQRLARAPEQSVREQLIRVSGIGPWTADIYLMFGVGRTDAFAPGDLALQLAIQRAFELAERPSVGATEAIAERWRPWRGVAARLLWTYYAATKKRPGAPV